MSKSLLFIAMAILLATHFLYYPKWDKGGTEATLSWDVSGYYMYLPATFIYKDLKGCGFKDDILSQYRPTPDFQQAFVHEASGNYVMKYSLGQALAFAPAFAVAHLWASNSSVYPADGFSFPYQFCISMGTLLYALIGMWLLFHLLRQYFPEWVAGLTVLALQLGSNYLNYSAIDGAMTHNSLFTLYALLIALSQSYHRRPTWGKALGIGLLLGWMALIRPTEIIACLIPLFWGADLFSRQGLRDRLGFLGQGRGQLAAAVLACLAVGSLQLFYWRYASGDWIVYSYQDQGFSWLRPHLWDGFFSYRNGWLVYSPFMFFALIGFFSLRKMQTGLFPACLVFSALFIYVTFAWDVWWYGGSLGQRSMVQCYPVLAFPLAAFLARLPDWPRYFSIPIALFMALLCYLSLWFTHQAHLGGMYRSEQMTAPYYWNILFTYRENPENLKLLDGAKRLYSGERESVRLIYQDSSFSVRLDKENTHSGETLIPLDDAADYDWLRIAADFSIKEKEWNVWQMAQFIARIENNGEQVELYSIRVQRLMDANQTKRLFIDMPKPRQPHTHLKVYLWSGDSPRETRVRRLSVETFKEAG